MPASGAPFAARRSMSASGGGTSHRMAIDARYTGDIGHRGAATRRLHHDRASRKGEVDAFGLEYTDELEVHRLLNVHVCVVVRGRDEVHCLEVEGGIAEFLEVDTVHAGFRLGLDGRPDQTRNPAERGVRRRIHHGDSELDSTLVHPLVIAYPRLKQIRVGNDDLLAREAP